MPYLLALDQGTSSSRTIDVDASGAVATSPQHAAVRDALERAFITAPEAAPGLSGWERANECAKNWNEADE